MILGIFFLFCHHVKEKNTKQKKNQSQVKMEQKNGLSIWRSVIFLVSIQATFLRDWETQTETQFSLSLEVNFHQTLNLSLDLKCKTKKTPSTSKLVVQNCVEFHPARLDFIVDCFKKMTTVKFHSSVNKVNVTHDVCSRSCIFLSVLVLEYESLKFYKIKGNLIAKRKYGEIF